MKRFTSETNQCSSLFSSFSSPLFFAFLFSFSLLFLLFFLAAPVNAADSGAAVDSGVDVAAFAFKIQPRSAPPLAYFFSSASCAGFTQQELTLPAALSETKDFAKTADYARQAQLAMDSAASYGRLQKVLGNAVLYGGSGLAVYAYSSFRCFEDGVRALSLADDAGREALRAAGANAEALQKMAGDDYYGAAAGALREVKEVGVDVNSGATEGAAFGKWVNRAANENEAAWKQIAAGTASSATVFAAVKLLINENQFLGEALAFNSRVTAAVASLESEVASLEREESDAEWRERNALETLDGEKLWLVGENAFQLVGSGATLSSQYALASFEDDLNFLREGIAEAQREQKQCSSGRSAKALHWASDCVKLLRDAAARLDAAALTARGVDSRSRELEARLRERVLDEQEKTRAAIDAVRDANPFAAAAAADSLEKNYDSLAQALETRGERISFYLREITLLRDLQSAAQASPFAREEKTALLARLTNFKKMISRAEADGLDVEFEKRESAAVEAAVQKLDESAKSTASLIVLKENVARLEEGVLAQATAHYSEVLTLEREKIAGVYQALTEKQKVLFDSYERFFDAFDNLRVREALGSLKKTREDYDSLLEYAELRLPELLKKNLEDGATVFSRVSDARLGAKALVRTRVELENRLPFSYDLQLLISIPEIAGALQAHDYSVVLKSVEVEASPNGLYLSSVAENGKYFFEFERDEQLTRETARSDETVYATRTKAVKRSTIRFDASRDALVVVPLSLPFLASLSGVSSLRNIVETVQSSSAVGSSFAAVIEALDGTNSVEFEYEIDSPVSVSETRSFGSASGAGSGAQRFDLTFVSIATLENVALDFHAQTGCSPKSVVIDDSGSSLDGEYKILGDSVAVSFKAKAMQVGMPYAAAVVVTCDSLETAYREKLASIQQLASKAELSLQMRLQAQDSIRAAQQTADGGDYGKALDKLYDAEAVIVAEQERGASETAARADYAAKEASVSTLISEAETASIALAAKGFAKESAEAAAAAQSARSFVAAARSLAGNGNAAQALNKLALAEDELRSKSSNAARAEIAALSALCAVAPNDCGAGAWSALELASALAAAGDFVGAFSALGEARTSVEAAASSRESGFEAKKSLISNYAELRDSFDSASQAFNDAFDVPDDYQRERSRSLDYQEGVLAQKDGLKRSTALAAVWTALETNDSKKFSGYSVAFVNDSAAKLSEDALTLREKTSLIKANAESALAGAEARQKQFGDETTHNAIDVASGAFDAGNFFTAWVVADAVNAGFSGFGAGNTAAVASGQGILDAGGDSGRWFLGLVGVVVLAALVYFLVLKQNRVRHRGL